MKRHKRKQLFVDPSIQGVLVLRTVIYWAFCLSMVTMFLVCWRIVTGPSRDLYVHLDYLWFHYGPVFIATLLLLPILIVDTLKISNRFAGPMIRLRSAMRRLADGDINITPLHFRNKDFWKDFAEDFNRLLLRLKTEQNDDSPNTDQNLAEDAIIEDQKPDAATSDNDCEDELAHAISSL